MLYNNNVFKEVQMKLFDLFKAKKQEEPKPSFTVIGSPFTGESIPLENVPDQVFAQKMMGDGGAVIPTDGKFYAPTDGTVNFIFPTKHALGFTTDTGIALLFHIGIDTVKLEGKGFTIHATEGQKVKKGDLLGEFDIEFIKENAPSIASMLLCSELKEGQTVTLLKTGSIKAGEDLLKVEG